MAGEYLLTWSINDRILNVKHRPFTCHIMQYNTHIFLLLQGNLYEFLKLTGWRGSKVLYFGDHIYSDLAVRNLISCFFVGYSVRPTY